MTARSIYVASSWRNVHQPAVVELLRAVGHEVYDFRNPPQTAGFGWEEVASGSGPLDVPRFRSMLLHARAQEGFASDLDGMVGADTCVLVLPCGRSAHLEAGWFCGQGRRLIVYIPAGVPVDPELMYLLAGDPLFTIAGDETELLEMVS